MSRAGTIARRTFLFGTVAIAGGVALGYYVVQHPHDNPLKPGLEPGEAALNPYVLLDGDGVTVITPRTDMGQGAHSVLAAMVAEELDLAWNAVRVSDGPPSAAYYNAKVAAETLPFAATDDGFLARNARALGGSMAKVMGLQITGGSTTVPDGFDRMRMAGAAARQMLLDAAAEMTGVPRETLTTREGHVVTEDGRRIAYGDLAELAAQVAPPDEVRLKSPREWRLLGQPMQRLDIVAKSTGTQTFGIDIDLPDMLYATVRTNPRRGGTVRGFDASAAEGMPGVERVVAVTGGAGVLADSTWRAMRAADEIVFEWGEAPYPATSALMWAQLGESFTESLRDSRFRDDGDVEATLADAGDGAVEAEYRLPHLAHAPLEPMNATARLKDGQLDIWASTQIPMYVLATAERLTGLKVADIHLHNQYAGGSFGRRLEDDFIARAIELAMAAEGRPVKMTWTREEDMSHDFPRPMALARGRGAVAQGRVAACDLSLATTSVAQSQGGRVNQPIPGPDVTIVAGAWDQPFAIPHYRVTGYRAPEMVPVSSWRSVGASGNGFVHESFLDELIHAAGADPLEERLRLCDDPLSRKVLEAVAEMSGWSGPNMGEGRGRGVAFTLSFGVSVAEIVEVRQTDTGLRIDKVFAAVEVGRVLDPVNFENQVKGGVIWGLGHAMNCELTYADGMTEQRNFDQYQGMRLYQAPLIEVRGLENGDTLRGIGEPAVPPAAPALANAIFAATGQRVRELPLNRHVNFA
ncbi:molybdopterin cofactor-binding domain-containing protein [Sediminimonas sp.]|uniref:xanthine dehydrogenase family protein molybdopterin-binding subunit n=1 Tax=Sediminimonas sp. TaxID=2823379 RepID=UPI0025F6F97D|nr:molybdopterin cofactor-binding domain-containing protein [Sediminimonas sp.]